MDDNDSLGKSHFSGPSSYVALDLENVKMDLFDKELFKNLPQLRSISLKSNNMTRLHPEWFEAVGNLTSLEISNNFLENVDDLSFKGIGSLTSLRLRSDHIKLISSSAFENMTELRVLDLSDNSLRVLPEHLFRDLWNLRTLLLNSNLLESLPKNLLAANVNLEHLDLSYNTRLNYIPEVLLIGLKRLKILSMKNCNLYFLPEEFLSHAPNLREVRLWNNFLTTLEPEVFTRNHKLQLLDLSFNHLLDLPSGLFKNQGKLVTLILSGNNITALPFGLFDGLEELKTLRMDRNQLTYLNLSYFGNSSKLTELDFNVNTIEEVGGNVPPMKADNLRVINLMLNKIKRFPSLDWEHYKVLEHLNLVGNDIEVLHVPLLVSKRAEIHLQNNKIKSIFLEKVLSFLDKEPSKGSSQHEAAFFLSGNRLLCDCKLMKFYRYVRGDYLKSGVQSITFPNAKDLICKSPERVVNRKVLSLSQEDFVCPIHNNCQRRCHCYLRGHDHAVVANCSNGQMDTLPEKVPENTSILHFENNKLSTLEDLNQRIWRHLSEIYLDHNEIETLGLWKAPPKLAKLSLKNNRLTWLPGPLGNLTGSSSSLTLQQRSQLYLSGNPWACNCRALHFRNWLLANKDAVGDLSEVRCQEVKVEVNGSLVNARVTDVPDQVLCPVENNSLKRAVGTFVLTTTVTIAILVIYFKNRLAIQAYLYVYFYKIFECLFCQRERKEGDDKTYDAFISYCPNDNDVAQRMAQELEPTYKLCLQERDWISKNVDSWNILNSVQTSRRTVLILSRDFLEALWSPIEMRTAFYQMLEDKRKELIIVTRGHLPPIQTMDPQLKHLLKRPTVRIKWGETWFWEKLCYLLPRTTKRPPILKNGIPLPCRPALSPELALTKLKEVTFTERSPPKREKAKVCTIVDFREMDSNTKPAPLMLTRV